MCWIYLPANSAGVFAVGYYINGGWTFIQITTRSNEADAQALVCQLNGGSAPG
ncbi:MAG TPA: hypothetical protein VHY19_06425 [Steroidobacteraceae bacterium]|jgi:hypothetical protein|nr:hypothetical protein [Steroidobacteraceae bacterium]